MVKVYLNPHACLINWPRGSSINGLQRRLWVITSISTPVLQLKSFGFVYNMWLPRQKRLVHSIQLYMLYNWKAIISSEQNETYLMITSLTSKKYVAFVTTLWLLLLPVKVHHGFWWNKDYTMITYSYQWQICGISHFYLTGKK
jgi:hypothetical protein